MARNYTIQTKIRKPVADVFEAVVRRDKLCQYFTNDASGDLQEGSQVQWHWDHYGESPVVVREIVKNKLIVLALDSKEWNKAKDDSYEVLVRFEFVALDARNTMLSISEEGWKTDAEGLKASHDNCGGWQHMAMCLKAWIEHDIDLR
ncbi:MAG TPA: SRPBCC domain-containing protein [Woeseiaceae bacterium]|nr:SRPBCC domain-containing protein [Woeseiaceae bacterium]